MPATSLSGEIKTRGKNLASHQFIKPLAKSTGFPDRYTRKICQFASGFFPSGSATAFFLLLHRGVHTIFDRLIDLGRHALEQIFEFDLLAQELVEVFIEGVENHIFANERIEL